MIHDSLSFLGNYTFLVSDTLTSLHTFITTKRGRRLGLENLFSAMNRFGVNSLPIVSLVLFCIGAILALQIAPILGRFGVVSLLADIISLATFRELGPLVSAIVLTGYAGAAIAAEVGTMVVSEEVEALEAHAIDPVRFLVVPRVVSVTIMSVGVAVVGDLMAILGGLVVSKGIFGLSSTQYLHHTFAAIKLRDFLTGLIKAGVFGFVISSLACYLGLGVTGGAQGVGTSTSKTVVLTIVSLIAIDLLFTAAFYFLGW